MFARINRIDRFRFRNSDGRKRYTLSVRFDPAGFFPCTCALKRIIALLIIIAGWTVPGGIVGAIIPGWIVGAGGNWISWTGRHATRFRIIQREMDGLGLLNLGRVDYATVRTQRGRWSAV